MIVRRRARVPGVPHARAAAEALRGRGARGADDARVRARRSRRTSPCRTSSPPRPRWPPSSRACRWRRSSPTSTRTRRRASRRSRSARGCRAPASGAALWRRTDRLVAIGARAGARASTTTAARGSGLPPLPYVHTGLSRSLTMVGDAAAARVPAGVAGVVRVVGPLLWEPGGPLVEPAPGDGPVVLVAPSTSQDPSRLAAARVPGGAGGRAGAGDRDRPSRVAAPANAVLVPWMSYAATMPRCDLVITPRRARDARAGAGVRLPVLVCPAGGDMAENAARVDWAGVGCAARAAVLHAVGRAAGGAAGAARRRRCARGRVSSPRGRSRTPVPPRRDPAGTLGRDGGAATRRRNRRRGGRRVNRTWAVPVSPGWPPRRGRCRRRRRRRSGSPRRRGPESSGRRDRAGAARGRGLRVAVRSWPRM